MQVDGSDDLPLPGVGHRHGADAKRTSVSTADADDYVMMTGTAAPDRPPQPQHGGTDGLGHYYCYVASSAPVPVPPPLMGSGLPPTPSGSGGSHNIVIHHPSSSDSATPRDIDDSTAIPELSTTMNNDSHLFSAAQQPNCCCMWDSARLSLEPRIRIPTLTAIVAVLVVTCILAVVFVITILLIQGHIETFLDNYADHAITRVSSLVERHFQVVRDCGLMVAAAVTGVDVLVNYPNHPSEYVQLFGSFAVRGGIHLVVSTGPATSLSYAVSLYSAADPVGYPQRSDGYVVVQVMNASESSMMIGYYNGDTGAPLNASAPLKPFASVFNFSTRPFWPLFRYGVTWSAPYTSIFTQTAGIGFGGPVTNTWSDPLLVNSPGSAFGLFDLTADLVRRLGDLKLSQNGKAMVFHRSTKAFIGGNVAEPILFPMTSTVTSNISSNTTTTTYRLKMIYEMQDPAVAAMMRAGWPSLLMCSATICRWIFERDNQRFSPGHPTATLTLFEDYLLVRSSLVTDAYGLGLVVVVAMPASDFSQSLRSSISSGVLIAALVMFGLVCLVTFGAHLTLIPIYHAAEALRFVFKSTMTSNVQQLLGSSGGDAMPLDASSNRNNAIDCCGETSSFWGCRCIRVKEVESIHFMIRRFQSEMALFKSFLSEASAVTYAASTMLASSSTSGDRSVPLSSVGAGATDDVGGTATTQDNSCRGDEVPPPAALEVGPSIMKSSSLVMSTKTAQQLKVPGAARMSIPGALPYTSGGAPWVAPVTFVAADLERFQDLQSRMLPTVIEELQSKYVRLMVTLAAKHGGAVGTFYGDRVLTHFNAERRCKKHAMAATQMMLEVQAACHAVPDLPSLRLGAATSQAVCGTMGPASLRRFHVVGHCVYQAIALSTECKVADAGILCSWRTTQLASSSSHSVAAAVGSSGGENVAAAPKIFFRHFRFAFLPYESGRSSIISQPLLTGGFGTTTTLQTTTGVPIRDPVLVFHWLRRCNAAFDAVAAGDVDRSAAILREVPLSSAECWLLSVADFCNP